jgi:hypothetical protein
VRIEIDPVTLYSVQNTRQWTKSRNSEIPHMLFVVPSSMTTEFFLWIWSPIYLPIKWLSVGTWERQYLF